MTRIREGNPEDLSRLREIQSAALSEYWPKLLETAAEGPLSLYVIVDPHPLGYAIVVTAEPVAYLPELAVDPDWQGQSYGSRLLSSLVEDFGGAGYEEIRLTVRVDDDRARSFYADHGFESRERLPAHFEKGDGLLLVRTIGE